MASCAGVTLSVAAMLRDAHRPEMTAASARAVPHSITRRRVTWAVSPTRQSAQMQCSVLDPAFGLAHCMRILLWRKLYSAVSHMKITELMRRFHDDKSCRESLRRFAGRMARSALDVASPEMAAFARTSGLTATMAGRYALVLGEAVQAHGRRRACCGGCRHAPDARQQVPLGRQPRVSRQLGDDPKTHMTAVGEPDGDVVRVIRWISPVCCRWQARLRRWRMRSARAPSGLLPRQFSRPVRQE
jgi:hypothetical protein